MSFTHQLVSLQVALQLFWVGSTFGEKVSHSKCSRSKRILEALSVAAAVSLIA